MTLNGAIAQLVELENNSTMPEYFKPSIKEVINVLTSDVVERKTGEWKKHNERSCWYCSECKADNYYAYNLDIDTGEFEFQDNFCPNCGADMRGNNDL